MDFMHATKTCFKKYFVFKGRSRRSEYWYFYLFTVIGGFVLGIIDALTFGMNTSIDFAPLSDSFSMAVLIPTISAGCRRLHDIGKSGWWQALPLAGPVLMAPAILPAINGAFDTPLFFGSMGVGLLALIGLTILLIVWLATDSHSGPNRFGESPKYGSVADTFS